MRAKVITLSADKESFAGADRLIDSSNHYKNNFVIDKYKASVPESIIDEFQEMRIKWNYPWTQEVLDMQSGLMKRPYETRDPLRRMACFMSHYRLWTHCHEEQEDYLIFEHDAIFQRHFDYEEVRKSRFNIVSINDPRGATRMSRVYHESLQVLTVPVGPAPYVDMNMQTPQGLPGNSAYWIDPVGAKKMLDLVNEYGAWPNDALMCNQLMPQMLGCVKNYATHLQPMSSTTTK